MQTVAFTKKELPYEINEEMKVLRTNIIYSGMDKKVILFTSSQAAEGKSTTVLELSKSMAELGKRVLLIDADLRKSVLKHKVTNPKDIEFGLTHYLSGLANVSDTICKTDIPHFYVIFAGPVPPNPAELLAGTRMTQLLEAAKSQFDYIFIDCAPLNMVIDAAVTAPMCDGAVMVIESGSIPYRAAQSCIQQLKNTGCPVLGVVLNKVDNRNSSKYSSQYYKKYGYKY